MLPDIVLPSVHSIVGLCTWITIFILYHISSTLVKGKIVPVINEVPCHEVVSLA